MKAMKIKANKIKNLILHLLHALHGYFAIFNTFTVFGAVGTRKSLNDVDSL